MANKKTPMRMCTGCRKMNPKRDMIRIVRSPEGEISLDLTGRKNGRGAYICKCAECLEMAKKSKALSRAFESNISDEIYDKLGEELKNIE